MGITATTLMAETATYACTALSFVLICFRLVCRHVRGESKREYNDDMWMALSVVPLLVRLGLIHGVLVNGTNAVPESWLKEMSQEEMERREVGSKMVLASRIAYAAFLWCMKACILSFLSRLMSTFPSYDRIIKGMGLSFILSFVGIVVVTLLECRPFRLYYQVKPPPPKKHCTEAFAQLLTFGIANIITDLMLIILPLPLILSSSLPLTRKLQVAFLFGLGSFDIAITIARMPLIIHSSTIQNSRSFWADVEILVACFVANAPVLNSFIQEFRKRRRKSTRTMDGEGYINSYSMERRTRRMTSPYESEPPITKPGRVMSMGAKMEMRMDIDGEFKDEEELSHFRQNPPITS